MEYKTDKNSAFIAEQKATIERAIEALRSVNIDTEVDYVKIAPKYRHPSVRVLGWPQDNNSFTLVLQPTNPDGTDVKDPEGKDTGIYYSVQKLKKRDY